MLNYTHSLALALPLSLVLYVMHIYNTKHKVHKSTIKIKFALAYQALDIVFMCQCVHFWYSDCNLMLCTPCV